MIPPFSPASTPGRAPRKAPPAHRPTVLPLALLLAAAGAAGGLHGQAELVITEINYNPDGAGDEHEFVEIKNIGTASANLNGIDVGGVGDIDLDEDDLAPGAHLVIVRNEGAFRARYPGVAIGGTYTGELGNGSEGERVRIQDSGDNTLFEVTYSDRFPWPRAADGEGYTLVPVDPDDPDDDPEDWRASTNLGGSPGADDPAPTTPAILVNEVLTRLGDEEVDTVELYNPNATSVNIGGWFLSDDAGEAPKYTIPAGTEIAAGGYLVLRQDSFGFGLSSRGELVYLSAAAGGLLTGYQHGYAFGASADGVSFGRHTTTGGDVYFVPLAAVTDGEPNALPESGPVIITEIMFNPGTLGAMPVEYIEIQNVTGSPQPLFDPANPGNTWQIDGVRLRDPNPAAPGRPWRFPEGITLSPGQRLVVVPFATDVTAFRANRDVPNRTFVIGGADGFDGALSNGGEDVALGRPENFFVEGDPMAIPPVPDSEETLHILVDLVDYNDRLPWPSADGVDAAGNAVPLGAGGRSLVRLDIATFGSEPSNWRPSFETGGTPGRTALYFGPEVYINEALTHTDAPQVDVVELYNPNDEPVDIGGWFLTDDFDLPRRFVIPEGTTIPAGGYFAINGDNDFNPNNTPPDGYFGSGTNGFSIDSRGDQIYLFSTDGEGHITGYVHGFGFAAAINGVSFGRHVDSVGGEHFVAQRTVTIEIRRTVPNPEGFPNSGPLVGPVVISELMIDPAPGGVEFIEIHNLSNRTVRLYDDHPEGNPNNTYRIAGVGGDEGYVFPNTRPVLAAGAVALVLPFGTDPEIFRQQNGVPAGVDIYGGTEGFTGALNNAGERITLIRPDKQDVDGGQIIIPLVDADSFRYDDEAPWPQVADASGRSLERREAGLFPDDPASWRASASPGGTPGIAPESDPFQAWRDTHFSGSEAVDDAVSGPAADPDADGLSNLLEYALGLVPTTPERSGTPTAALEGGFLSLSYTRSAAAVGAGTSFTVEVADDPLGPWESGAAHLDEVIVGEDSGIQTVRATDRVSADAAPGRVIRLKVAR